MCAIPHYNSFQVRLQETTDRIWKKLENIDLSDLLNHHLENRIESLSEIADDVYESYPELNESRYDIYKALDNGLSKHYDCYIDMVKYDAVFANANAITKKEE